MEALPSLPSLTPDDRAWRLDWFGECAYPGSVRRYAQPSIKVVLSPLRCDPNDREALLAPDSTDHQRQHEAWQPVAALPLLAIGDIWQHGKHLASPDYHLESFRQLNVTAKTAAFVKAGLAIDGHFLLPLARHPWHRHDTQSYCVSISMEEGRRLLVPCGELIRFYFGSSSYFIQRLFTAPLRAETFWTSKRFNPENRHLHVVLASRLSGASASDIGRIAENRFAWRAAAGVYASCQKAVAQRHPAYPYTGFPFEGTTDLVASGVWLPFGEREKATFLAYRLRSCSYPFPFHSLSYEADERKASHGAGTGNTDHARRLSRERATMNSAAIDADPGGNKTRRSHFFRDQHRFPDLTRKQVWREKFEVIPTADVFLRRADGRLEQVAFGENDTSSAVAGFDAVVDQTGRPGAGPDIPPPHFVQLGLRAIALDPVSSPPDAQMKLICLPGKTLPVFSLPVVIDELGEIAGTLCFTSRDGRVRQRRGCIVEVTCEGQHRRFLLILEGAFHAAPPSITAIAGLDVASVLATLRMA